MKFRIGQGYDVHKLEEGESLILGGVNIKHYKGTVAHSDGDVLIHAICDAILGAANLRDIGYHFPDNSQDFKNVDSRILLRECKQLIAEKGYQIGNIDSTICMQTPKLKDHIEAMKLSIAQTLSLDVEDVSVKATTTEKLGFVGKEEGVSALASVLIYLEE